MDGREIRFFFDYVSPYAYLAWTRLPLLGAKFERTIEPTPVLLAAILNTHGQLGPAEIPAKRRWVYANVARLAARFDVPLRPPAAHPFNPLLILRLSSLPLGSEDRRALIDALFRAAWEQSLDVTSEAVILEILENLGLDGRRLLATASEPETKGALRTQTEDAIRLGVFGVPTLLVDGELFWGFDDLDFAAQHLAGRDCVTEALRDQWERIPVGAARKR